ncbi:RnfH family protein [Variovorax sp. J22G21]|uniref:RnfH family protein n=1 Tax=Variovorax fucosicus TaxID=3053517 RepID=UPI002577F44D|nr:MULTISPECIES: RnfH family protein [unclassified Variovorax]MDM0041081.1 RnfH family protein [Variovorax sp. J22R193]MDM0057462.1 RnfH family protein [Variovorax sp. J22G47]MDM0060138.1 RnfH family protein [Variovorax sp. J22G21]
MQITLVYSPAPREVFEALLTLPEGATARDAVLASALPAQFPALDWAALPAGLWGRAIAWDRALSDGDRIELCRPLVVDPKVARRERFRRQGARATGLFARRRDGGKAGY